MDKKELEEIFLAGWEARDQLYRPASERWNAERDQALADFIQRKTEPLRGTHR